MRVVPALLLLGCSGSAEIPVADEHAPAEKRYPPLPVEEVRMWELEATRTSVHVKGPVRFPDFDGPDPDDLPSDHPLRKTIETWCNLESEVEAFRDGRCRYQVAEAGWIVAAYRGIHWSALQAASRKGSISDCHDPDDFERLLSDETQKTVDRFCTPTGSLQQAEVKLTEQIDLLVPKESPDTVVLRATVRFGDTVQVGSATWSGARPPHASWNLGRLVALGCAYAAGPETLPEGDAQHRYGLLVASLEREYYVHTPFWTPELGVHQHLSPEGLRFYFFNFEEASEASNWWNCQTVR